MNTQKNISGLACYLNDPLFTNSFYIILTSIFNSLFGFLFWIIAAKLYANEEVGLATALISSMTLLVLLSKVGMDYSLIRFFPNNDKNMVLSTSLVISVIAALLFGIVFIYGVDIFSPELNFIKSPLNAILFIGFLIANTAIMITGTSFIAMRRAGYNFIQNLLLGLRVLFLLPLVAMGTIGIFGAMGISLFLTLLVAYLLLIKMNIKLKLAIDHDFLKEGFSFSAINYATSLLTSAPNMLLPIMVLNRVGAEQAAYYYISFAIASILFMIPSSIGTSLLVEGSHGESLKKTVIKSGIFTLCILIPASIILYIWGDFFLRAVGDEYATQGFELLKLMVIASFFVSVNCIYASIKRVQKDNKLLITVCALNFILLILMTYFFLIAFGTIGVGYAWIGSYAISSIAIGLIIWKKENWI